MHHITIQTIPGFEEWRNAARQCLQKNIPPDQIIWTENGAEQVNLLLQENIEIFSDNKTQLKIPKAFIEMAEQVVCHSNPDKYALLYRILWRIIHENKNLLHILTDSDILKMRSYVKAVRRDAYKITAFLRFREVNIDGENYYIAWYEPEHFTLELKLDFFMKRFKNMRWSILTPYRAAHWSGHDLVLEDNPDPSLYPEEDQIEKYWWGYYANIFNPARLKLQAMTNQMPKKYWKNMPETKIIQELINTSEKRVKHMIDNQKTD